MKKLIVFAIAIFGFTAVSFGQATANAPASATIITPISLSKTTDMNFGNIAVNNAIGTVLLTPASTRTPGGGVTLPAAAGTVAAAVFTVGGAGTNSFSITLPSGDFLITRASGSETMVVNGFTSTPSGTGALVGGTATINVGATLNVGASQVAGVYTNVGGFAVTVNYN